MFKLYGFPVSNYYNMVNAQKVEADRQAAMPAFMAMIAAKK